MRLVAAGAALVAVGLASCAATPRQQGDATLPTAAQQAPERYVVVTVRNVAATGGVRAGATARGYDAVTPYAATSSARAMARAVADDYHLHEAADWPISLLGVYCLVYEIPPGSEASALAALLARDRRVESAQLLGTFSTQSSPYNDPYAGLQQSLPLMAVSEAQQWSRGEGVTIAVVDTGVDAGHPDLRGRIAGQRNFVDSDASAFSADLHGTAVAGVIAAVANNHMGIAGIAPAARLLAFKACWHVAAPASPALCNTFTLAQALAAAIDAHADIVNLSLAGPGDPLLTRIVERGMRQGMIFVGAAPPAGARTGFPGNVDGVITVDAPSRQHGDPASLTAPGHDVLTLVPGAHYDFASGSSLAAAQTSAVVALLLARDHRLHASEAQQLLSRTSKAVTIQSGTFTSINACAALVALQQVGSCDSTRGAATDRARSPGMEAQIPRL